MMSGRSDSTTNQKNFRRRQVDYDNVAIHHKNKHNNSSNSPRKRKIQVVHNGNSNKINTSSTKLKETFSSESTSKILEGVCICLTGLLAEKKLELHRLVVLHGGRFTRDLLTHKTTHLIAESCAGEKFKEAVKCSTIEIVTPEWLEMCHLKKERLGTGNFRLLSDRLNDPVNDKVSGVEKVSVYERNLFQCPLDVAIHELFLSRKLPPNPLFSSCCFFFVGFSENDHERQQQHNGNLRSCISSRKRKQSAMGSKESPITYNSLEKSFDNNNSEISESSLVVKQGLLRLVRICMGTVLWDLNEHITHIIVSRNCHEELRKSVTSFCRHHPNGPIAVSPQWIVASVRHKRLQLPRKFLPLQQSKRPATENEQRYVQQLPAPASSNFSCISTINEKTKVIQNDSSAVKVNKPISSLYLGAVFHIVRLTSPPQGTVKFDAAEVEELITSNGGHILSQSVVDILKRDIAKRHKEALHSLPSSPSSTGKDHHPERVCFVVSLTGGYVQNHVVSCNPLLSQVNKQGLCKIVPVTPVWIQTCIADKVETRPDKYPLLFQPQKWFLRKLPENLNKGKGIKVSVTGFLGGERSGMQQMLKVIGAEYTENMRSSNTHLICKEAKGAKFKKALEWGLHVISEEWLHCIVKYGYGGQENDEGGCENNFSMKCEAINHNKTLNPSSEEKLMLTTKYTAMPATDSERENKFFSGHVAAADSSKSVERSSQWKNLKEIDCNTERIRSALKSLQTPIEKKTNNTSKVFIDSSKMSHRKRCRRKLAKSQNSFGPAISGTSNSTSESFRELNMDKGKKDATESSDEEETSFSVVIPPTLQRKAVLKNGGSDDIEQPESQSIWYGNQSQYL